MNNEEIISVLVAEDNTMLADVLAGFLENHGYVVTLTYNGRQAARALSERQYDVLITDIVMPEMDGLELLTWMQDNGLKTRVIVATSVYHENYQMDNAENIILTLEKPFEPDQLSQLIETLNAQRHTNQ